MTEMTTDKSPSKTAGTSSPANTGNDEFVRLHISPLDPDLLKIVVPAAVLPSARNISYHTIETFPEKRYGFVELPQMDADKIKKKLNGTTLKGSKLRIEKARPEERTEPTGHPDEAEKKSKKRKSKDEPEGTKKRKRDRDVVDGVVLRDRKVKRGWTEAADSKRRSKSRKDKDSKDKSSKDKEKRKQLKSKYTDGEECLLKTKLPPNTVGNLPESETYGKKKKKGKSREVTIHEFEKTTKFPSFLKNSVPETNGKPATEFVDGKGWVDEDGNLVEQVKEKDIPKPSKKAIKKKQPVVVAEESDDDDDTSSSGSSSSEEEEDEDSGSESEVSVDKRKYKQPQPVAKKTRSSSEEEDDEQTSSDDSSEDEEEEEEESKEHSEPESASAEASSSNPAGDLTINIPPPPATPSTTKAVHPLEALYKRAKPDGDAAETPAKPEGFSFFGDGDGDLSNEDDNDAAGATEPPSSIPIPMTPYTKQDFEWRNVRSAAPTPDTAHPSRMKNFWAPQDDNDDDVPEADLMEEDEGDEATAAVSSQNQATSDFQTWFWENRRDLNRSWMSRRKTVAKEKRHRENKARASKAV